MSDKLTDMLNPRERLLVSCDKPRDLMERILAVPDEVWHCTRCGNDKPPYEFLHPNYCRRCHSARVARNAKLRSPQPVDNHQKCLHCLQRFPIEVFEGKKLCPQCHARRWKR